MANYTPNYNLKKPLATEYYSVEDQNGNMDLIDTELKKQESSLSELTNAVKKTETVSYGMNNVIRKTSKVSSSPKFTIQGKTLVNLLGKDGNCENVSKWTLSGATNALDTTNKIFDNNGIKITLTSALGLMYKTLSSLSTDTSKYYFVSAHLKNGNATSIALQKDGVGGGTSVISTAVSDNTKFTRVGIAVKPSDLNSNNELLIRVSGTSGQYAYVDGIAMYEITADEYNNMTVDQLLAKYPYVDSYTCLTNLYAEIRHNNLVINGNCEENNNWWIVSNKGINNSDVTCENGYFVVNDLATTAAVDNHQIVPVSPNANYVLRCVAKTNGATKCRLRISFIEKDGTYVGTQYAETSNTTDTVLSINALSTAKSTQAYIAISGDSDISLTGKSLFKEIMLVEGPTPPAAYKPNETVRTVIEGRFADGDSVVYKDGKVSGSLNWKHKVLYGKDYDWQMSTDYTGYKSLVVPIKDIIKDAVKTAVKWDGTIIKDKTFASPWTGANMSCSTDGALILTVSDSDTGWLETVNPNNDEVKALMNGWRAVFNSAGRYIAWVHYTGGSSALSADTSVQSSASNVVTFTSHPFSVGDYVVCPYASSAIFTITGVTTTTITLNATITVPAGQTVFKSDASGSTNVLNYCMNNVAPGFEGWQLHYKLANPEPITDLNVHIEGDILTLEEGENYLFLDSGMVLGEVANPQKRLGSPEYDINIYTGIDYPDSRFKFRAEKLFSVYKNMVYDTYKWNTINSSAGNGLFYAGISDTNLDTTATYTVDYKILATIAPRIGAIACEYVEDIISAIDSLQEAVGSRQVGNSALDAIADMSLYEKFSNGYISGLTTLGMSYTPTRQYYETTNMAEAKFFIPFKVEKAVVPKINLTNFSIYIMDSTGTATYIKSVPAVDSTIRKIAFDISKIGVIVSVVLYAGTNANNALANGMFIGIQGIADCRERI